MAKFILIILVLFALTSHSQNSDFENVVYNVGLGSVGSAIGAVINKKENEKTGTVFLKGLWQGSIGGGLIYGGKKIVTEIPKTGNIMYNWPAKVVNAAGVSNIENAASNRAFGEAWHINIGFNRIELHTQDKFKINYKVSPISLGITLGSAINRKPEWGLMLRSGEIIFSASKLNVGGLEAYTINHTIIFEDNSVFGLEQILAHEFIHVYQNSDYNFINAYFNKPLSNLSKKSPLFNLLNNYFYWELHYPIQSGIYLFENIGKNNFYEREAGFYSPDKFNSIFNN